MLAADPKPDERMHRRPTSEEVRYCRRGLTELVAADGSVARRASPVPRCARQNLKLLEWCREVVHGRIYAEYGKPDQLQSGRRGISTRTITSAELYELANIVFKAREPLMHASMFALPRFIDARAHKAI